MHVPPNSNSPYPPATQHSTQTSVQAPPVSSALQTSRMPLPIPLNPADPSNPTLASQKAREYENITETSPPCSTSSASSTSIRTTNATALPLLSKDSTRTDAKRNAPPANTLQGPDLKKSKTSSIEFQKLREIADLGDPAAQYLLACEYFKRASCLQDYGEGVKWLRCAAKRKFTMALSKLSHCYANGIGVQKNPKEAEMLYTKATASCEFRLGSCQYTIKATDIIIKTYPDFEKFHLQPASEGDMIAYNILARSYINEDRRGKYDPNHRSGKHGITLLHNAAIKGDPLANYHLGMEYLVECTIRDVEFPKMTYAQSAPICKKLAFEHLHRAADKGLALAQYELGHHYVHGGYSDAGLKPDPKKGVELLRSAAKKGLAVAQIELGHCLREGKGADKDFQEAMMWYRLAANQGDRLGITTLAQHTDNLEEAQVLRRRFSWMEGWFPRQFKQITYYALTSQDSIDWKELCRLSHQYPEYIDRWKNDTELHERTGISFIDHLDEDTLRTLPAKLFTALVERVCDHLHNTIQEVPLDEKRIHLILPGMQFLLTLKTICGEKKPNNEKELLDRMNITLAEPYVATFDYLQALTHLKEITYPCPEANVKLAKLLYNCPDWIFPEIAQWQNRYALIVALMASNNEELKDDEKMILYNVIESLEQSRQTFVSHGPLLTPQLKTRCLQWLEGKADAVKPFYDLLSREHVESYFRYHSMKIRLNEALSRNASSQTPRSLPFLQPLSDAVEFHLSGCGAHLPPLHPPSDVEALQLLVDCCLTLASSDHLQEAFQNLQVHFNSPLIQKWMASIPAFTDSLKAYLNNSPDLT